MQESMKGADEGGVVFHAESEEDGTSDGAC